MKEELNVVLSQLHGKRKSEEKPCVQGEQSQKKKKNILQYLVESKNRCNFIEKNLAYSRKQTWDSMFVGNHSTPMLPPLPLLSQGG